MFFFVNAKLVAQFLKPTVTVAHHASAKAAKAPAKAVAASQGRPLAFQSRPRPAPYFDVMFSDTDVAQVLQAISARTGAGIVYAGKDHVPVSVNVRVNNVEDAVRSVVSAAGLAYRKAGNIYIVAPQAAMRQALAPYGASVTAPVPPGTADHAIAELTASLPDLTVRPLGDQLVLTGLPEDLSSAQDYLAQLARQNQDSRVVEDAITVEHASAADLAKIVGTMYPDLKVVTTAPPTGGGLVALAGPADTVERAKQLLARMDVPSASNVDSVTRVVTLKYTGAQALANFLKNAAPDVEAYPGPETFGPARPHFAPLSSTMGGSTSTGGSTSSLGSGGGAFGGMALPGGDQTTGGTGDHAHSDRSRIVVLRGSSTAVANAVALIDKLDVKPAQVMVQVQVVETSKTFAENLGVQYNFGPLRFTEVPAGTQIPTFPLTDNNTQITKSAGIGSFSRVPWDVLATLNAQVQEGKAKMLANPSVQVVDDEDANIFIGDTIRARVAQASGLGAQTVEIEEFPIGIVLLIRPRIGPDGTITMHVNPVVSSITSVDNNNIPQTSSREAETTVMVKDGETIVIGGLIHDDESRVVSRVPILSQLPIIGELFKNRSTNKTRTDIVVTITPHIVRDGDTPGGPKK